MSKARIPSAGLKILESLYTRYSNNPSIINSLITAYISLGYHSKALNLISLIPKNKSDSKTLKLKAWQAHKNNNLQFEKLIWDEIIEKTYYPQIHAHTDTLLLRSEKEIDLNPSDIPMISVIRNEITRLPYLLDYYRSLGVTKFFFIDNNSNDGSFEFLCKQIDCHVFWTNDSYFIAGYGMKWVKDIVDTYVLNNQWYLIIDADEFLVYPHSESKKLSKLIDYLNDKQFQAVPSFYVDMFPNNLNTDNSVGNSLLKYSPYFYNNFYFKFQTECPYYTTHGGIRTFSEVLDGLTSVPLVKNSGSIDFFASRHSMTPVKLADIFAIQLHFKFLPNFFNHCSSESKRKQHSQSGNKYYHYYRFFKDYSKGLNEILNSNKITKYRNSQQLIDLGLIKTTDEWDSYA